MAVSKEHAQEQPNITEKFGKERLEDIQEKIAKATGLAFVTVDYAGNPVTETTRFSEFCKHMRQGEKSCELCKKSDAFGALQAAISRKPSVYFCPCGLLEVAIPIVEKGAFLGGFIGGQIQCSDAPQEVPKLSYLLKQDDAIDAEEQLHQYKESNKKFHYEHFLDVVNLIALIIGQMNENQMRPSSVTGDEDRIQELVEEKSELKKKTKDLEQDMASVMMTQNQFFMANVLASISGQALMEGALVTNELLLKFADYFRKSSKSNAGYWIVEEEVELIECYIQLSCLKYGDRFQYQIHMAEKIKNRQIPAYSVLPYVEHAVYYGISLAKGECRLEINFFLEGENCIAEITEDGSGYDKEQLQDMFREFQGSHEGYHIDRFIYMMEKKLKREFGVEYSPKITVESGKGRTYRIRIPELR